MGFFNWISKEKSSVKEDGGIVLDNVDSLIYSEPKIEEAFKGTVDQEKIKFPKEYKSRNQPWRVQ